MDEENIKKQGAEKKVVDQKNKTKAQNKLQAKDYNKELDKELKDHKDLLIDPAFSNKKRHYEIVLLIHPDRAEGINKVIEHYTNLVNQSGGVVHRLENWGCLALAYLIKKVNKAIYLCLNIEIYKSVLEELKYDFTFNESVLRHLIVNRDGPIKEPSIMLTKANTEK